MLADCSSVDCSSLRCYYPRRLSVENCVFLSGIPCSVKYTVWAWQQVQTAILDLPRRRLPQVAQFTGIFLFQFFARRNNLQTFQETLDSRPGNYPPLVGYKMHSTFDE